MTNGKTRNSLVGLYAALAVITCLTAPAEVQTTMIENLRGATTKLTEVVKYVEGNTLVARISGGEIRTFIVPGSIKFVIDGKELTMRDLKPGMLQSNRCRHYDSGHPTNGHEDIRDSAIRQRRYGQG
jgi:hypothetical protein